MTIAAVTTVCGQTRLKLPELAIEGLRVICTNTHVYSCVYAVPSAIPVGAKMLKTHCVVLLSQVGTVCARRQVNNSIHFGDA